jgi:hypothetical protein
MLVAEGAAGALPAATDAAQRAMPRPPHHQPPVTD